MSKSNKLAGEFQDPMADPVVAGALKHFKASVDTWSEAAYSRPRLNESRSSESKSAARTARHNWRLAASCALGCLLIAGSLAGGLYERRQRQEAARAAEMKAAEQKVRLAAEQRVTPMPVAANIATRRTTAVKRAANTDEDLLATVDNDVSRQVPAAMEPLAQMMDNNGSN
ncbi:MAG: hypothetical protein WDM87_07605 [Terracidiphilus sp.]